MLTQKYGGKHVFGFGIIMTAVLTILTPLAAKTGPEYIIAVRVLEGVGEVSIAKHFNHIRVFAKGGGVGNCSRENFDFGLMN